MNESQRQRWNEHVDAAFSKARAYSQLPDNADLYCTLGYPGVGGYLEYHRTPDGTRFVISNGPWDAVSPFNWTCERA